MNQFTHVGLYVPGSNTFSLSHEHKFSCDAGFLIPTLMEEVLPGDTFSYSNSCLARLTPMVNPVMHKIDVSFQSFFVPSRIIWANFPKFMEQTLPDESSPVAPYFSNVVINVGDLGDYMGLPTAQVYDESTGGLRTQYDVLDKISALPFAAYQKVFSDWYQPVNLGPVIPFTPLTDGANTYANYSDKQRRGWQHDYFTAASISPQAGEPVIIPLGESAPINYVGQAGGLGAGKWRNFDTGGSFANQVLYTDSDSYTSNPSSDVASYDPNGTLRADLSQATGVDVETLRWSITLQQFLERKNLGGGRYIEMNLAIWGVKSSDQRLQRAEMVGSSTQPVVISEVLQTSASTEDGTPLAEMGGHGLSFGRNGFRKYYAEEHGFFVTLACIRPRTAYSQGLSRMWTRFAPLDYPVPTFANLGEQAVKNREIYFGGDSNDDADFGYQPRYSEYRNSPSRISGEFRTTLAPWTMSRIFGTRPSLNAAFVRCTPTERIFAVTSDSTHSYLLQVNHKLMVSRKLPKYAIPGLKTV
jgi:hypothetical protein